MNRRQFITIAGLGGLTLAVPAQLQARHTPQRKVLILVELRGGNDGINTVIPYADAAYAQLRPGLHIPRDQVLQLGPDAGLHPALDPLMSMWNRKEMAIVEGVGYPDPNRSHFRSKDIWTTASDSAQYLTDGWIGRAMSAATDRSDLTADGLIIDSTDAGPMQAPGARSIVMHDPDNFLRVAQSVPSPDKAQGNDALQHILGVQSDVRTATAGIAEAVRNRPDLSGDFGKTPLAQRLQSAAELLTAGLPVLAIKVGLKGFDTHANQKSAHARLLGQLAEGLAAFRRVLVRAGKWRDVVVVTVSEFGRRPSQNGSGGTDHGTAAPLFVLGGSVKGGRYGSPPSLTDLDGGDLKYAVDFRSVYATLSRGLWNVDPAAFGADRFTTLPFL